MSPDFSTDLKERIRERIDLAALIGETVRLTPKSGGREFLGLCPFHDDHNPSFRVYPDRQSYRCWVCNEGGDCFAWVMNTEKVGFREALEALARRAGVELPSQSNSGSMRRESGKAGLYEVLAWAATQFHECLLASPLAAAARDYLKQRGFTGETIARFQIGYHPNDWEWIQKRAGKKFPAPMLFEARLVGQSEKRSGYYDNLVDRVVFPIRDDKGRPVAFGGRVLPGNPNPDLPKYWNSPESSVFSKSRLVYGFDAARDAIRKSQTAVVVEGYTDCILAHQYGISNVVGTLGTALTELHVANLKRFARQAVLVYDGDEPGKNAAERAVAKILAQDIDLRVLTLPAGMDPAEYLLQDGTAAFQQLIDQAPEAWDYKFAAEAQRHGLTTIDGRDRVLEAMLELVAQAARISAPRESMILKRLAERLGVDERIMRGRLSEVKTKTITLHKSGLSGQTLYRVDRGHESTAASGVGRKPSKDDKLECDLIGIIFTAAEMTEAIRHQVRTDEIQNPHLRAILETCFQLAEQSIFPTSERVLVELEDAVCKQWVVRIDDLAQQQEIRRQLDDEQSPGTSHVETGLLKQTLDSLKSRRDKQRHDQSRPGVVQEATASSALNQEVKARLRESMEYNRKRATKKNLT